eukprot:1873506-Amphidinium_carterae.1
MEAPPQVRANSSKEAKRPLLASSEQILLDRRSWHWSAPVYTAIDQAHSRYLLHTDRGSTVMLVQKNIKLDSKRFQAKHSAHLQQGHDDIDMSIDHSPVQRSPTYTCVHHKLQCNIPHILIEATIRRSMLQLNETAADSFAGSSKESFRSLCTWDAREANAFEYHLSLQERGKRTAKTCRILREELFEFGEGWKGNRCDLLRGSPLVFLPSS